jgi:lipoprotein-anchoring transpeptidase ErfK/SrfK
MLKHISLALLASASCLATSHQAAAFDTTPLPDPAVIYSGPPAPRAAPPVRTASADRSQLGGGFIEFLFGEGPNQDVRSQSQPFNRQPYESRRLQSFPQTEPQQDLHLRDETNELDHPAFDPRFEKQLVDYHGKEGAGTIIVDTPNKFLFLVEGHGKALRYGIGVGRPGFTWSGVKQISAKKEWPDWTPPPEMLTRRPDLPRHMEGGPQNPLGARAMYLGSSLYRIHGSNEPWTIGTNVSSGCIRMRNEDVIDLYGRVNVGAKVVVL